MLDIFLIHFYYDGENLRIPRPPVVLVWLQESPIAENELYSFELKVHPRLDNLQRVIKLKQKIV